MRKKMTKVMVFYYLSHGNFGCVIYANTVDDESEKMKAKRGKMDGVIRVCR